MSIDYYNKLLNKGAKVHFEVLPDTDHFMIINPESSVWSEILESVWLYNREHIK